MIQAKRRPTLVVVGTGMAGGKVVEEILNRDTDRFHIRMFGAEPHGTYNRILLSTVLGGFDLTDRLWLNTREWYEERGIHLHGGVKVDTIDPKNRVVVGGRGNVTEPYDVLVLATGSRPFVPPIEGVDKQGVFVFRTLEDCQQIATFAEDCQKVVVLGGGLLGLEAARGLLSFDLDVTVVEMAPHLMPQQLDEMGGNLLQQKMEEMGVRVLTGIRATQVLGEEGVTSLLLDNGTTVEADMVVISCGIRPNVAEAKAAGLYVDRAVVVDDQMRTSEEDIFAVGECAQHRGKVYGLVDPIYEQVRVLADVLTEKNAHAKFHGARPSATLKVMGVDLVSMGNVGVNGGGGEVVSHLDSTSGIYKKFVLNNGRLEGAILLGAPDPTGRIGRLFKNEEPIDSFTNLLTSDNARDELLDGDRGDLLNLPDDTQICNCNEVPKGKIIEAIRDGHQSVQALGKCTKAGTGCGTCQPLLTQLIDSCTGKSSPKKKHKVEVMKEQKNGLDILEEIQPLMADNNWKGLTGEHKDLIKWHGLFFRKPTPGNFMLRLRMNAGQTNSKQFRVIADLSDEFGKGFCDLTTRQQIQMRWFTLADVSEIWRRLAEVGLHSKQTGMDNIRGVCGCPVSGLTPHEHFDASGVAKEYSDIIVDNREFTNLPRKFNVTITGCLENCCHTETQDIALVPATREIEGQQVKGFNVYVGGKQGSGGYTPATSLDVFVVPEKAAKLCAEITRIFRDYGKREARNRARFAFLVQDRGVPWVRAELQKRMGTSLDKAGNDVREKRHVDHIGIHPQSQETDSGGLLHYVGIVVPVGRITTAQMRAVADVADRYGNGDLRLTVGQNAIIPNVPESRLEELKTEPLFQELSFDPSPIMRGLISCTGNDYCAMALIDTKSFAVEIAIELEKRAEGRKLKPLTIHWSGCPAGCGLHQVASIGLQGCRSRVNGKVVDAAHVCINGKSGPEPQTSTDVLYDVPTNQLTDVMEALVSYLPRAKQ